MEHEQLNFTKKVYLVLLFLSSLIRDKDHGNAETAGSR
jgi:hypothetical protein